MKTYQGRREGAAVIVTVDGRRLNPRLDLRNHSPTGFEWGYAGSGPAQLSLALLADHLRNQEHALEVYQEFKRAVVAKLPYRGWSFDSAHIDEALRTLPPPVASRPYPFAPVAAMKVSELLPQTAPPPWSVGEDGRQIFAWKGTQPMNQVCIGRLYSPADACFACHATGTFMHLLTALKLLLACQGGQGLPSANLQFCKGALADAQRIDLE